MIEPLDFSKYDIAMDYVEEYDEVLNLCVRMLPLLQADKL